MYFSHWKPLGVAERMWSVNLDASISAVSDPRRAFLPAFRVTGSAGNKPGSADDEPGRTWERRQQTWERWWQTWERRRHVWEHLESVMYSVCILIYVSVYLYSYPSTHGISGLATGGAWEQCEVRLKMTIEWTQRYTPRLWSSEFGDALGGDDRACLEIHLEAVIEWT